jgi:hypothetical protein
MTARFGLFLAALVGLGGCATLENAGFTGLEPTPVATTVPESIVALAAPNQDVQSARVLPEDGCYWYSHAGPVETTLLPLRTVNGNPICTQPAPVAASAPAATDAS